jgi:hypothetical protein
MFISGRLYYASLNFEKWKEAQILNSLTVIFTLFQTVVASILLLLDFSSLFLFTWFRKSVFKMGKVWRELLSGLFKCSEKLDTFFSWQFTTNGFLIIVK